MTTLSLTLMTAIQQQILTTLMSVARQQDVDFFVYRWHIMFDWPQHILEVNRVSLHPAEYNIPSQFSQADIDALVTLGYFEKLSEIRLDELTFETVANYRIIHWI